MKAPTLTKERRAWLQSLKDGADHEVVHVNMHHITPHCSTRIVRFLPRQDVLAEVMRTNGGSDWLGTRYTKSGLSDDKRLVHNWIEPMTDAHRQVFRVRRLRDILQRLPTWERATDAQILACAETLGLS